MRTLNQIVGAGACDACRGRITKCSAEHPVCWECRRRSTPCVYTDPAHAGSEPKPRPDPNAPREPKTAYVLFGESVRQDPALSHAPIADIEKAIERRWQALPQEERLSKWENPVAQRRNVYQQQLERYKHTENYQRYQIYLEAFNQRRGRQLDIKRRTSSDPAPLAPPTTTLESEGNDGDQAMTLDTHDFGMEGQSCDATTPVKYGMAEVHAIVRALGVNPHVVRVAAYPLEEVTTNAVEDFLNGTGALLYLWERQEALDITKSVYHSQNDGTLVHATEVFAMATVGSYCDGETGKSYYQEWFLEFFLSSFIMLSAICDFRCMRLFSSLAVCRFTNNVVSARKLMLAAINIGRQKFISADLATEYNAEERQHWWNVFRSMLFLESWFAYNTNHESRVTHDDLKLYEAPTRKAETGPEVFHEPIRELGQLAAYIALDLKTADQPKVLQARTHLDSLNKWHRNLPPPMQLSSLSIGDPFATRLATKRSLLQSHILFLGIFIEPYRNCLVDLGNHRLSDKPIEEGDLENVKYIEEQCVLAARHSARVASLLQIDSLVRAHCWISMYTSFTGCAILLFSASQKLLLLQSEEIGQDLSYASSHLNLLSLCSYENSIAKKLYTKLQIIFNDIREIVFSPIYRQMREERIFVKDPSLVTEDHYDDVEGAKEMSLDIVESTRKIMEVVQDAMVFKGS